MKRELPAAVLFDMDGLLIDSERLALTSVEHAASVIGWPVPDPVAHRLIGLGRDNGSRVLQAALGQEFPVIRFWDAWYDDYRQRVSAGVPAKAGATHALAALQAHDVRCAPLRPRPRLRATNSKRPVYCRISTSSSGATRWHTVNRHRTCTCTPPINWASSPLTAGRLRIRCRD